MRAPYDPRVDLRQQRLAERVHELGPKPMLFMLREIEAGGDLTAAMERYAALPVDFVRAMGGDQFARPLYGVVRDEVV